MSLLLCASLVCHCLRFILVPFLCPSFRFSLFISVCICSNVSLHACLSRAVRKIAGQARTDIPRWAAFIKKPHHPQLPFWRMTSLWHHHHVSHPVWCWRSPCFGPAISAETQTKTHYWGVWTLASRRGRIITLLLLFGSTPQSPIATILA